MLMNKLIILRGNSGSGKTTIAKELQRKMGSNTLLISQDVIRREMLMVKDGPDTMALPMLKELLIYGRNHCETVILEGILVGEWYRSLFEQAKELGFVCLAEGAENRIQIDRLRELGCEIIQGYYYSKPIPLGEYEEKYL